MRCWRTPSACAMPSSAHCSLRRQASATGRRYGHPADIGRFPAAAWPVSPTSGDPYDRVLQTKQVAHSADAAAEPNPGNAAKLGGARSTVIVPMLKDDQLIGTIVIYRQEVRPFTDKLIELVQNFAAQAVIAIENTRLLNELRDSLQQQTATAEVLRVISSSPGELDGVFQTMLENATRLCEAKFGAMVLREGDAFRTVAMHNAPPAFIEERQRNPLLRPGPTSGLGRVIATRQALHIPDVREDQGYLHGVRVSLPCLTRRRAVARSCALAEGRGSGGNHRHLSAGGASFHPRADRAGQELCSASRHRHREHPAAQRAARIVAAADRHRRRAQGDQPLDLRSARVLDTLVESATRLCDAYDAVLLLREGEWLVFGAHPVPTDTDGFRQMARQYEPGPPGGASWIASLFMSTTSVRCRRSSPRAAPWRCGWATGPSCLCLCCEVTRRSGRFLSVAPRYGRSPTSTSSLLQPSPTRR